MKVVGFTFIRNAIKYDYPIVEAILSIEPLCDEIIVSLGKSDDGTEALIAGISNPKIKIVHTIWDDTKREKGEVLAEETNKAFDAIEHADWCIYIQGDEVMHEHYHGTIKKNLLTYKDDASVEGLLLKYKHFYGSYEYVGDSRKWYRNEIRIIRNDKRIRSYRDAQGFRKSGQKLQVKQIDAYIYHYGWVKEPLKQQKKVIDFNKLWHSDDWVKKNILQTETFKYDLNIDSLIKFEGTHPAVMAERIKAQDWEFKFNLHKKKLGIKGRILYWIESKTGYRVGEFKNYKLI